ncbi:MAG: MarR family winged helix-turn-helix transcriptional regulator [Roseibium sp.]
MAEDDFSLCVLTNVRKSARSVSRFYDQMARKAGFTAGQFSVLVTVREHEGLTSAELAERLSMERTTLVRNVALLETKGLLVSEASRVARGKSYRVTSEGAAILERALPLWRDAQNHVKEHLGEEDFLVAVSLLKRLSQL